MRPDICLRLSSLECLVEPFQLFTVDFALKLLCTKLEMQEPTLCSFCFVYAEHVYTLNPVVTGAKWILQTDDNIIAFMIVLKNSSNWKKSEHA